MLTPYMMTHRSCANEMELTFIKVVEKACMKASADSWRNRRIVGASNKIAVRQTV